MISLVRIRRFFRANRIPKPKVDFADSACPNLVTALEGRRRPDSAPTGSSIRTSPARDDTLSARYSREVEQHEHQ